VPLEKGVPAGQRIQQGVRSLSLRARQLALVLLRSANTLKGKARAGVLNPSLRNVSQPVGEREFRDGFLVLQALRSPEIARACQRMRAVTAVHSGFCTATCPTYVLLGDELDSPRGRIYLIKDMLENDRPATADVVQHIDRCLSCLACMTTCPSAFTTSI